MSSRVLVLRTLMPGVELNDMTGGVPLRLPMTPASSSSSSMLVALLSATLGGRPPTTRCPFCRLGARRLPVELAVDALEASR